MQAARGSRSGQATLELLGLLPLLIAVAVGLFAGLSWLAASGQASDASITGARALAVGADARAAALAALPAGARKRATVTVVDRGVRVRLRVGGRLGHLLPPVEWDSAR